MRTLKPLFVAGGVAIALAVGGAASLGLANAPSDDIELTTTAPSLTFVTPSTSSTPEPLSSATPAPQPPAVVAPSLAPAPLPAPTGEPVGRPPGASPSGTAPQPPAAAPVPLQLPGDAPATTGGKVSETQAVQWALSWSPGYVVDRVEMAMEDQGLVWKVRLEAGDAEVEYRILVDTGAVVRVKIDDDDRDFDSNDDDSGHSGDDNSAHRGDDDDHDEDTGHDD